MVIRMQINRYKYPFVFIAFCLIIGIISGKNLIHFPLSLWLTITFFLFSLFLHKIKRTKVLNIVLVCALISAGILRYHLAANIFPNHHIINLGIKNILWIEGVILDYQYKKNNRHTYVLNIESAYGEDTIRSTCGKILLFTKKLEKKYTYGDRIRVNVSLEKPIGKRNPGQFDYKQYLINQKIFASATIVHDDSISCLAKYQGNWFLA